LFQLGHFEESNSASFELGHKSNFGRSDLPSAHKRDEEQAFYGKFDLTLEKFVATIQDLNLSTIQEFVVTIQITIY